MSTSKYNVRDLDICNIRQQKEEDQWGCPTPPPLTYGLRAARHDRNLDRNSAEISVHFWSWISVQAGPKSGPKFSRNLCQVSVIDFGLGRTEICRKFDILVLFFNPNFFLHHLHLISPKPTSNLTFSYQFNYPKDF